MFQYITNNIEGCLNYFYFHNLYSQIWLDYLFDDCHFSTITKKERKKKKLLPLNDFNFLFLTKRVGNFWENELWSVNF